MTWKLVVAFVILATLGSRIHGEDQNNGKKPEDLETQASGSGYADTNDVYNGELYGRNPGYYTGLGTNYGGYYGSPTGAGISGLGYSNLGYGGLGYGGAYPGYSGYGSYASYGGSGVPGAYPGYGGYGNLGGYGGSGYSGYGGYGNLGGYGGYYGRPGVYG